MTFEFVWPERGNPLFAVDDDPGCNVTIDTHADDFQYFEAYKVAEEGLYTLAMGRDPSDDHLSGYGMYEARRSQLAIALVFVARQQIELSMKRLLTIAGADPKRIKNERHDLVGLWAMCCPMIEDLFPDAPVDDLAAVGEQMRQLHEMDPGSDRFRYAEPIGGGEHPTRPGVFSLRIFHERMEELNSFFLTLFVGIEGWE